MDYLQKNQYLKIMAQNHNITLSLDENNNLVLSDHGETDVDPGDSVTWIVPQNSSISEIIIMKKTFSPDVFKPNPTRVGNSKNWSGNINSAITPGTTENYGIGYTIGTDYHYLDPKIKVNL